MLKKLLAFFEVVLVVVLIILIIAIFTFYMSFSKENSLPSVLGNSFFILNTDDMQNENGTGINKGSLVIASDNELDSLKEGMVVLCDINDIETAEPVYNVLRIYTIEPNSESTLYTVSNEKMAANRTYIIGKDKIVAKCTYSSDTLGQIIAFSKTTNGIVTLIILPCVILIALQIVHLVARAKRNKFEKIELEEFEFPSDMTFPDDEQSPLYNVAKHDFADKVNVEDNFSNKNEKTDKKSKKKSSKADKPEDAKIAASKSNDDKDLKSEDDKNKKSVKENRKAIAVKVDDTDNSKDKTKSKEKDETEAIVENMSLSADNDTKAEDTEKSSIESDNNDTKSEKHETIDRSVDVGDKNDVKIDSDKDANKVLANETNEDKAVADESASEKAINDKTAKSQSQNSEIDTDRPDDKSEEIEINVKSESTVKTDADVVKPKKKTTVKKRTTVKKTSSTSASDLLKAIDSESKKLQ